MGAVPWCRTFRHGSESLAGGAGPRAEGERGNTYRPERARHLGRTDFDLACTRVRDPSRGQLRIGAVAGWPWRVFAMLWPRDQRVVSQRTGTRSANPVALSIEDCEYRAD